MADNWQDFEKECYSFLASKYGSKARFTALGQSDSTVPDILVVPPCGNRFYIETKSENAQCGQFVLIPDEDNRIFEYSPRNSTPFFSSTKVMMDYMNDYFDDFCDAGTGGVRLNLPKNIFYSWIKDYYSSKGVRFFITKAYDYIIIPIEKFDDYFDVVGNYRIKKSGSSSPSESNIPELRETLIKNDIIGTITKVGKEYYLQTTQSVDGCKLRALKYAYMLREATNNNYRIRKLSNTNNANVIFQISLKKAFQNPEDLRQFENSLI